MLTYKKLYQRVRESTGLDVLTPGTMQAIVENCDADLTGRGYRDFLEVTLEPERDKREDETEKEYEEAKKLEPDNKQLWGPTLLTIYWKLNKAEYEALEKEMGY